MDKIELLNKLKSFEEKKNTSIDVISLYETKEEVKDVVKQIKNDEVVDSSIITKLTKIEEKLKKQEDIISKLDGLNKMEDLSNIIDIKKGSEVKTELNDKPLNLSDLKEKLNKLSKVNVSALDKLDAFENKNNKDSSLDEKEKTTKDKVVHEDVEEVSMTVETKKESTATKQESIEDNQIDKTVSKEQANMGMETIGEDPSGVTMDEVTVEEIDENHYNKVDDGRIPDISFSVGVHSVQTAQTKGIAGLMDVAEKEKVEEKQNFVKAKAFGRKDRDRDSNVEVKLNYAEMELSKKQIKEFEKSMTATEKKTLTVEEQEARLRLFLLREKAIDEKDKKDKMEERRLTRVKEYDDFIIRQNESHIVGFRRKG